MTQAAERSEPPPAGFAAAAHRGCWPAGCRSSGSASMPRAGPSHRPATAARSAATIPAASRKTAWRRAAADTAKPRSAEPPGAAVPPKVPLEIGPSASPKGPRPDRATGCVSAARAAHRRAALALARHRRRCTSTRCADPASPACRATGWPSHCHWATTQVHPDAQEARSWLRQAPHLAAWSEPKAKPSVRVAPSDPARWPRRAGAERSAHPAHRRALPKDRWRRAAQAC